MLSQSVADEAREYIAAQKPVGPDLTDQLMVQRAMLAGGRHATGPLTEHARTNLAIVRAFGGEASADESGIVHVGRSPA